MSFRIAFFKGTHPGLPGVYSWAVRRWTKSAYSHCELIFSDGISASSAYLDKGVRFKQIDYAADPESWDILELPAFLEPAARAWFEKHKGEPYDLKGNFHFILSPVGDSNGDWFCNEACGAALGMADPWQFYPGSFAAAVKLMVDVYNQSKALPASSA